jgi:hypothetical protein
MALLAPAKKTDLPHTINAASSVPIDGVSAKHQRVIGIMESASRRLSPLGV